MLSECLLVYIVLDLSWFVIFCMIGEFGFLS